MLSLLDKVDKNKKWIGTIKTTKFKSILWQENWIDLQCIWIFVGLVKNLENKKRLGNNFDDKEHDYFSMLCCAFSKNMKIGVVANWLQIQKCVDSFIIYMFGLIFTLAFVVVWIQTS